MNPRTLDRLDALHARLYRWRWGVRIVVAILVVPWLCRFASLRINGLPLEHEFVPYADMMLTDPRP